MLITVICCCYKILWNKLAALCLMVQLVCWAWYCRLRALSWVPGVEGVSHLSPSKRNIILFFQLLFETWRKGWKLKTRSKMRKQQPPVLFVTTSKSVLFNAHTKPWKVSAIPTMTFFLKRRDSLGNRLKADENHFVLPWLGRYYWMEGTQSSRFFLMFLMTCTVSIMIKWLIKDK